MIVPSLKQSYKQRFLAYIKTPKKASRHWYRGLSRIESMSWTIWIFLFENLSEKNKLDLKIIIIKKEFQLSKNFFEWMFFFVYTAWLQFSGFYKKCLAWKLDEMSCLCVLHHSLKLCCVFLLLLYFNKQPRLHYYALGKQG